MSIGLVTMTDEERIAAERFRYKARWRCPACLQVWYDVRGLKRHMGVLHHACRFCPKAYIRVDRHERHTHTNEYAVAAGACERPA